MIQFPVEKIKGQMCADLGGLVAIESLKGAPEPGKPFGSGPYAALCYMLEKAEGMGFEDRKSVV